jgi:hypothetical protein
VGCGYLDTRNGARTQALMLLALAALAGLAVGASLGLLGGGGASLMLPLLVALEVEPKQAIALSLAVVGTTAAVAALRHARAGYVDLRAALLLGPAAAVGGFAGGRAAALVSGEALLLLFTGLMGAAGVAMLLPRGERVADASRPPRPLVLVLLGVAIGALTGLVGAGGGFLFVPTLALLGGLPLRRAIGTSLVLIAANSAAGLAGHLAHVSPDPVLGATVTGAAVAGAWLGAGLAGRVPESRLRRAFGVLVLAIAAWMLARSPLVHGWLAA